MKYIQNMTMANLVKEDIQEEKTRSDIICYFCKEDIPDLTPYYAVVWDDEVSTIDVLQIITYDAEDLIISCKEDACRDNLYAILSSFQLFDLDLILDGISNNQRISPGYVFGPDSKRDLNPAIVGRDNRCIGCKSDISHIRYNSLNFHDEFRNNGNITTIESYILGVYCRFSNCKKGNNIKQSIESMVNSF